MKTLKDSCQAMRKNLALQKSNLPQLTLRALATALFFLLSNFNSKADMKEQTYNDFYNLSVMTIDGEQITMQEFAGKVLLIVNTASRCGFTPQYEGLQKLYDQYQEQGVVVLGFPSNDFMEQEPGSNEEIKKFCSLKYNVSFPMFSRNHVKGASKQAVYKFLTESNSDLAGEVKWNFEKFLVNRKGQVVNRFSSFTKPDSKKLIKAIEAELKISE